MKPILLLACVSLLFACQEQQITNTEDYKTYLEAQDVSMKQEALHKLQFWNSRIKQDSTQIIALGKSAQEYAMLFKTTGDITFLKKAESVIRKATNKAHIGKDTYLRSLAHNLITQHQFKEAAVALQEAQRIAPNKRETHLMQFDVAMELGNYPTAETYLYLVTDFSDFNYLIRLAKWKDYIGDLDAAIHYMEQATDIVDRKKDKELQIWSYTNLGDYYGHAGRIKDSYAHYLKALQLDPYNAYAKKGIAWITYSHEKNPEEALRILDAIQKQHQSPDYFLLKAEIADYQNKYALKNEYLNSYFQAVQNPSYGDMYNTYTAEILLNEHKDYDTVIEIAQKEIKNRPTPQSYDLLAYAYQQKGEYIQALAIAKKHIENKTHEPTIQFHLAEIYKANGLHNKVAVIKKDLLEASYELGPMTTRAIHNL